MGHRITVFSEVYYRTFAYYDDASILFFVAGTTCTWSSPAIPKFLEEKENPFGRIVTADEISWISSLMTVGAIFGPFLFGYLADKVGRKHAMIYAGIPFLISYLLMATGQAVQFFYIARTLAGISVGGTFLLVPMYLGEISESKNRGLISCLAGSCCCLGLLFTVCLGPYTSLWLFNTVLAVPTFIFLSLFAILGVESPVYLVKAQKPEQAEITLKHLGRTNEMIKKDVMEMQAEYEIKKEPYNIFEIFSSKIILKGIISALGLLVFQQLSGVNAITFYSAQIFEEAGTSIEPHICSIILVAVQFFSSFIAPCLVDRSGRKTCLLISALGMILTEGSLAFYCHFHQTGFDVNNVSWIPIASLATFIIFFNIGYGPLPWIIMAEMFSTRYRSSASAFVATTTWAVSFVITKYFNLAVSSFGIDNVFFFSTACCVASVVFSTFYILETKGKSLLEIQEMLNK